MTWVTPQNPIGLNLGAVSIDDTTGALSVTPDPTGADPSTVINNIVYLTNTTGSNLYMQIEYTDPTGSTHSSTAHRVDSGSVFLVVDVEDADLSLTARFGVDSDDTTWTSTTITVNSPVALDAASSVDVWLDSNSTPYAAPAIVPAVDGRFTMVNRTGGVLETWINSSNGATATIPPGESHEIDMEPDGVFVGQWLVGFKESGDPTIVVRRPPLSTGSKPSS